MNYYLRIQFRIDLTKNKTETHTKTVDTFAMPCIKLHKVVNTGKRQMYTKIAL